MNIFDISIEYTDVVNLLGVTFDRTLCFNTHISDICRKASKQLNVLKRFSSILSAKNKLLVYTSFIISQFQYCPVVWHFCRKSKIRMIEKIQERSMRFIYNDTSSSYVELLQKCNRNSLFVASINAYAFKFLNL